MERGSAKKEQDGSTIFISALAGFTNPIYIIWAYVRYAMKTQAAVYYFRVCAKVLRGPKLKVALIMNYVAGEEAVCVEAQG